MFPVDADPLQCDFMLGTLKGLQCPYATYVASMPSDMLASCLRLSVIMPETKY